MKETLFFLYVIKNVYFSFGELTQIVNWPDRNSLSNKYHYITSSISDINGRLPFRYISLMRSTSIINDNLDSSGIYYSATLNVSISDSFSLFWHSSVIQLLAMFAKVLILFIIKSNDSFFFLRIMSLGGSCSHVSLFAWYMIVN